MPRTSWSKFIGEIQPKPAIVSKTRMSYSLNRPKGSLSVDLDGSNIVIQFISTYDNFEDLYYETFEFVQSFLAVQALETRYPVQLVLNEWTETPVEPVGEDAVSHPIKGRFHHGDEDDIPIPDEVLAFSIAQGMLWAEDIDTNSFLRRAVLDFNFALQHSLNDIPIYLYRAIECAQAFFGSESALIKSLGVREQVRIVKKLANSQQLGFHIRHAAETTHIQRVSKEDVIKAIDATKDVLVKFHDEVWSRRISTVGE